MSVKSTMYDIAANDPSINGIVSGRIYPNGQPKQGAKAPYLVQEIIGSERPALLNGVCPVKNYQVRWTGICRSDGELTLLMKALEDRFDGYKGGAIKGCQQSDENTNPNPDMPTEHSESMVFSVWFARDYVGANN